MRRTELKLVILFQIALTSLLLSVSQAFGADFSTPENTLAEYIAGVRNGDRAAVAKCFDPPATDFYLPRPLAIETYSIVKRITYGKAEVKKWNSRGVIPSVKIGDVELQVKENVEKKELMFSYVLRRIGSDWKIISHSVWGEQ
jgi:hypothetical protein